MLILKAIWSERLKKKTKKKRQKKSLMIFKCLCLLSAKSPEVPMGNLISGNWLGLKWRRHFSLFHNIDRLC